MLFYWKLLIDKKIIYSYREGNDRLLNIWLLCDCIKVEFYDFHEQEFFKSYKFSSVNQVNKIFTSYLV